MSATVCSECGQPGLMHPASCSIFQSFAGKPTDRQGDIEQPSYESSDEIMQLVIDTLGGPIKTVRRFLENERRYNQMLTDWADNEPKTRAQGEADGARKLAARVKARYRNYVDIAGKTHSIVDLNIIDAEVAQLDNKKGNNQ